MYAAVSYHPKNVRAIVENILKVKMYYCSRVSQSSVKCLTTYTICSQYN